MLDIGGGGSGGGHFVGLQPDAARGLAGVMAARGSHTLSAAARIAGLLDEAGAQAAGCSTPATLRTADQWLDRSADDVRWRVALVAGDAGGSRMRFASLTFASAAAARLDGRRYAARVEAAMRRYFDADSDEDRAAAEAEYLALLRGIGQWSHDPQWAGGLVNRIGIDGISNALWVAGGEARGDVDKLSLSLGPMFSALATGMRHRTADPSLRRDLLTWPNWDLALIVGLAPAETGFLTAVARRVLVLSQTDDDRATDPTDREYALVYGALAENPEASYRLLTSKGRFGEPIASYLLPWNLGANQEATRSLGRVLEAGLVEYPAGKSSLVWNRATVATEAVMHHVARLGHLIEEADPQLGMSLVSLLRPHLDTIAVIGARAGGMHAPAGFDVALPAGRRALDVDVDTLRKYLGAAMQHDSGIAHMQLLLAAYTQSPQVQANRLPMLDELRLPDLNPFAADSVRIAGLVGLVGAGLDEAGKDEEKTTSLLVGAMNFAAGKGASKLISGSNPVTWLAQRGVKHLAGEGVKEIEQWLQSREPLEGEVGVDSFLESYVDTTVASLREHIAADPQLSRLPRSEQEALLASAGHLVENLVSGPLRISYADLVAETAKE